MANKPQQQDLRSRLEQFQQRRTLITILRDIEGVAPLDGFVLKASSQWVLLQYVDDFRLDGFCLLRTEDIESVQHGKFERFRQKVLDGEGLLAQVGRNAPSLDLKNLSTALGGLQKSQKLVTLLGEWPEVDFLVAGRLKNVSPQAAQLEVLSALGMWEPDLQEVALAAVSLVTFDDHYLTTLSRYAHRPGQQR